MAIEAHCPILPVAVTGSDNFFKRFPRRALVQITVLPLLMPDPGESPPALTDRLMFTLAQALPEEMPEGFLMTI